MTDFCLTILTFSNQKRSKQVAPKRHSVLWDTLRLLDSKYAIHQNSFGDINLLWGGQSLEFDSPTSPTTPNQLVFLLIVTSKPHTYTVAFVTHRTCQSFESNLPDVSRFCYFLCSMHCKLEYFAAPSGSCSLFECCAFCEITILCFMHSFVWFFRMPIICIVLVHLLSVHFFAWMFV